MFGTSSQALHNRSKKLHKTATSDINIEGVDFLVGKKPFKKWKTINWNNTKGFVVFVVFLVNTSVFSENGQLEFLSDNHFNNEFIIVGTDHCVLYVCHWLLPLMLRLLTLLTSCWQLCQSYQAKLPQANTPKQN